MAASEADGPAGGRDWALPAPLRRTVQLSCYGDLSPQFRRANLEIHRASLAAGVLWAEAAMLRRLLYKNTHQHRGGHFMRYLLEVRRALAQLQSLRLDGLLSDLQHLLQEGGAFSSSNVGSSSGGGKGARGGGNGRGAAGAGAGAGGGGGGGGRTSYRLPSRDAAAAVMSQLVAGTALVRGLQRPLHSAAGQLGAQLALTYFVPLATTAAAMLARIKVLSLQLALDCVKAYNDLADALPLLPALAVAGAAAGAGGGGAAAAEDALRLSPALSAALQPAPPTAHSRRAGQQQQPRLPSQQNAVGGVVQARGVEPPSGAGGSGTAPEVKSRSLRMLLQPSAPSAAATAAPGAPGLAPAADGGQSAAAAAAEGARPLEYLPQMIRCHWDEQAPYLPFVEAVPTAAGEPDWQQRAARAAEQYGIMLAVQYDDSTAATAAAAAPAQNAAAAAAAAGGGSMPASAPAGPAAVFKGAKRGRDGAAPSVGAGSGPVAAAAGSGSGPGSDVGVKIDRRSFFDMMAAGSKKRTHASQPMAPLQVFEDRAGAAGGGGGAAAKKARTQEASGAVAAGAGSAADAGTDSAAAAASARLEAAGAAAAAAASAAPAAACKAPSAAVVPAASPVVLSYATRSGFMLGRSGAATSAAGAAAAAAPAAVAATAATATPASGTTEPAIAAAEVEPVAAAGLQGELAAAAAAAEAAVAATAADDVLMAGPAADVAAVACEEPVAPPAAPAVAAVAAASAPTPAPPAPGSGSGLKRVLLSGVTGVSGAGAKVGASKAKPAFLSVGGGIAAAAAAVAAAAPAATTAAAAATASGSGGGGGGARSLLSAKAQAANAQAKASVEDPLMGIIMGGGGKGKGKGGGGGGAAAAGVLGGAGSAAGRKGAGGGASGGGAGRGTGGAGAGGGGGGGVGAAAGAGAGSLSASLELLLGGIMPAGGPGGNTGGKTAGGRGKKGNLHAPSLDAALAHCGTVIKADALASAAAAGDLAASERLLLAEDYHWQGTRAGDGIGPSALAACFCGHSDVLDWAHGGCERAGPLPPQETTKWAPAAAEGGHAALLQQLAAARATEARDQPLALGGVAYGCSLALLQSYYALWGGEGAAGSRHKQQLLLRAAASPTPDWAAKCGWLLGQWEAVAGAGAGAEGRALGGGTFERWMSPSPRRSPTTCSGCSC
ncbi:hypothetical protein HYH02_008150 [Chlamydomonas schloesseri]|uniref:Nucleolus and neural progenitor protein-like N-terminal domain-containing protein n=1 Tax=Chlamydomonas schloesseri TaxID=2026947 RepID=A0A835WGI6_9CHLO|nr:hypothetical protein HYH02_008150 [Chlamydomonas schloesseri]|eukprot:KAG2446996.1 hypothetical protein HYH02_008150 [Chlamydomonas schloesseri]